MKRELVADGLQELEKLSLESKKTALFHFVKGLIYKASGSAMDALREFDRARKIDPNFADARREMGAVRNAMPKKMDMNELFTGDLGSVVKNIFGKKKGA
jgi:hypothetical protein